MKVLAIETSCDETAISIIEADKFKLGAKIRVLSNVVNSQAQKHAEYGGVFPSLAVREHSKNLVPVLQKALEDAGFLNLKIENQKAKTQIKNQKEIEKVLERESELREKFLEFMPTVSKPDIDAIAVTYGPGLEPTLWVGVNFAKALAAVWNLPLIPVNHMEGHIFSALLEKSQTNAEQTQNCAEKIKPTTYNLTPITFPVMALLISGGHTELVLMRDWFDYEIVGQTKDDAAGEAFDKVARMLGLGYPGGPAIAREAEKWRGEPSFNLPRPMMHSEDFNFSFSGLKTAVLYKLKEFPEINEKIKQEMSYEFQEAVTDVLVSKTLRAAEHYGVETILVGGGVSANKRIKDALVEEPRSKNYELRTLFSPVELTGDNALMIAVAAWARQSLKPQTYSLDSIHADGNVRLS